MGRGRLRRTRRRGLTYEMKRKRKARTMGTVEHNWKRVRREKKKKIHRQRERYKSQALSTSERSDRKQCCYTHTPGNILYSYRNQSWMRQTYCLFIINELNDLPVAISPMGEMNLHMKAACRHQNMSVHLTKLSTTRKMVHISVFSCCCRCWCWTLMIDVSGSGKKRKNSTASNGEWHRTWNTKIVITNWRW